MPFSKFRSMSRPSLCSVINVSRSFCCANAGYHARANFVACRSVVSVWRSLEGIPPHRPPHALLLPTPPYHWREAGGPPQSPPLLFPADKPLWWKCAPQDSPRWPLFFPFFSNSAAYSLLHDMTAAAAAEVGVLRRIWPGRFRTPGSQ
jgi:hypothetical protein